MQSKFPLVCVLGAALILSACFESDDSKRNGNGNIALNQAPTITGSPPPSILEGQSYEFIPTASDPDGDTLEFTIARKPAWASFDRATGRLWGTPATEDAGNFTNVGISVSDGTVSAALADFDITVNQIAVGSASLSWTPPTENADGSVLSNLAGYRIYYGRNASNLTETVVLTNAGLTRYVVDNLSPAKWYFSMTSVNSNGVESDRSGTASKTIS
jgi:hypothetical protein